MMIAAVVVFSARILNNLTTLRRLIIQRWRAKQAKTDESLTTDVSPQPLEHAQ
jgi:hypothetical protein